MNRRRTGAAALAALALAASVVAAQARLGGSAGSDPPSAPAVRRQGGESGFSAAASNSRPADPAPEGSGPTSARKVFAGPIPGLVQIPSGRFERGDHHGFVDPKHGSDELPVRTIRIDAFAIGVNDVTTKEYCEFLNAALAQKSIEVRDHGVYLPAGSDLLCETRAMSPYSRIGWDGKSFTVLDQKEDHPMVCVRWEGAVVYCNWLSAKNGHPQCYKAATWECDFNKSGFRLPTEAEWEYAARGGQYDPYWNFPWANEADAAKANWPESTNPYRTGPLPWTTPVGFFDGKLHRKSDSGWPGAEETFQTSDGANGFGLYDMSGNVWQWCTDWYERNYYAYCPEVNPPGPAEGSPMPDGRPCRVMRGGNWFNGEYGHGRVSNRDPSYFRGPQDPNHPFYHIGFRVVLPAGAESRPAVKPTPVERSGPAAAGPGGRPPRGENRQGGRRPPRGDDRRGDERRGGGGGRDENQREDGGQQPRGEPPRRGLEPDRDSGKEPAAPASNRDSAFVLRSPEVAEGGALPKDYTGDGSSATFRPEDIASANRVGPEGETVGLFKTSPQAFPGYTLFAPKHHTLIYLIDNQGRAVHQWKSQYEPGQSVYLLENGHLLHCCFTRNQGFTRGGEGGRLEEFDWEGNLVWEFEYSNDEHLSHHDVKPLPNGNILVMAVEKKAYDECLAAGFDPRMLRDKQLFPELIIEVQPTRPKGGKIVWEWHVWDHLIQNRDRTKPNYGDPAAHPERIDVDCNGRPVPAFWNHGNSIAYNAKLDQVMLSARGCSEIWVIDHSTTTAEAAGRSGGRSGKGGDLLYRWGNPAAYGRGADGDRRLFQQHDAQWIPDGCPGAGHILIFNNGLDRGYSTIEEIVPPMDANGRYSIESGKPFGPEEPAWRYQAQNPTDFYSSEISGAHRLLNGNTLICAGVRGDLFEVTSAGQTVWEYVNPVVHNGILAQGEMSGLDHRGHNWNAVFKVHRYPVDYPGLADRDLAPIGPIEQPASMRGKTGFAEQPAEGAPEGKQGPGERRGGGGDRRPPRDDNRPGRQGAR